MLSDFQISHDPASVWQALNRFERMREVILVQLSGATAKAIISIVDSIRFKDGEMETNS